MDLKLCPHCMTPITTDPFTDEAFCPNCGQDTSSTDRISMDDEQYYETPRKECLYCGQQLLRGATYCPGCKAELPE